MSPGRAVSSPSLPSRAEGLRRVEAEIRQAKAEALGRLGERLDAVLAELAAHDRRLDRLLVERRDGRASDPGLRRELEARNRLRAEARQLVQHLIIQREAIGLTRHGAVFDQYPVPPRRQINAVDT